MTVQPRAWCQRGSHLASSHVTKQKNKWCMQKSEGKNENTELAVITSHCHPSHPSPWEIVHTLKRALRNTAEHYPVTLPLATRQSYFNKSLERTNHIQSVSQANLEDLYSHMFLLNRKNIADLGCLVPNLRITPISTLSIGLWTMSF